MSLGVKPSQARAVEHFAVVAVYDRRWADWPLLRIYSLAPLGERTAAGVFIAGAGRGAHVLHVVGVRGSRRNKLRSS
jgi:hypothetical protein